MAISFPPRLTLQDPPARDSGRPASCEGPERALGSLYGAVVMIVDDEPLNVEVTEIFLRESGYTRFVSTSDPHEVLALIEEKRPDVLLLDLMMPGMSGLQILAKLADAGILRDIPALMLTSSCDGGDKLRALELGATDFLSKPLDPDELRVRLRNTLSAKAYRDRLAHQDLVTGLPNRRAFLQRLEWSLRFAQRTGCPGAVLQVGLDNFKRINEALGPSVGDEILQEVARRLERCVRSTDVVARAEDGGQPQPSLSRISGDEFTLLLPLIGKSEDAARVAQRIIDAIDVPFQPDSQDLRITCSIGIAVFPDDGADADTIVRNAAAAMASAKRRPQQSYRFYSNELNVRALQKLTLANQLRRSLESDQLLLYYQPKTRIDGSVVIGAEALVRWQHPERGLLMPNEFVPVAEEAGLSGLLSEGVLRAACRQTEIWRRAGFRIPRIAINVSSHELRNFDFAEVIERTLQDTGANPGNLSLELTESVLLDNIERSVGVLHRLKEIGLALSIDDFGTGYSSLSYLNEFPLDELKIDRSFVRQIGQPGQRSAIVLAIIVMAHSLGLKVVAEGVETQEQLDFLKRHGCDEFQGYLTAKPIPADEFTARFLESSA